MEKPSIKEIIFGLMILGALVIGLLLNEKPTYDRQYKYTVEITNMLERKDTLLIVGTNVNLSEKGALYSTGNDGLGAIYHVAGISYFRILKTEEIKNKAN